MTALKKLAALFLSIAMVCSMSLNVFAVTGSTLAADGTYSGYSSEGTVTVTVSNGKIANVSANVKSKYQSYISSAFSSVIGKTATANNIDAVSSATKHMNAIKSGAKSAIASAPAADGSSSGDDSGGESGGESGGGSGSGQSETEYTIAVGGTQELSVIEDGNYSYSWTSSDSSKVSISGSGHAVTVKGEATTESPVKVTCTYGFMGINMTKEFFVTVTGSAEPEEESEIGKGVGEKSGTKYTGKAFLNNDETDEWVELDVYVADGKIAGIFITAEDGHWLNLLTNIQSSFVGKNATTSEVDAVSSATTLGFRDTIRNAVSAALENMQEETPAEPVLTSGNGSTWTKGSGTGLSFTSDAEFSAFKSVKVDGAIVSSSGYSVSEGSTVVTLNSSYLETLSSGSHSIAITSINGTASGTFTVAAGESGSASSGDAYTLLDTDSIGEVYLNANRHAPITTYGGLQYYLMNGNTVYYKTGDTYEEISVSDNYRYPKFSIASDSNLWKQPYYSGTIPASELQKLYVLSDSQAQQPSSITLNPTTLSLALGESGTVAATPEGCTLASVTSSNENVATAAISGNTITVNGIAAGTAVFTVSGSAASGYTDPDSVTFTVTVAPGGSGGSGTGGGTTTTTPGNPTYVKSIAPENTVADEYTISLNVTADDLEKTTTIPGTPASGGTNLVMVIDISGSIVGKEAALNSAIQSLVKELPENSQVGIVTFNETASMSQIYSPDTISGLTFSGVEDAGTTMAVGIRAATSLLNGSGWSDTSNNKAMVIISDFDIDDYCNSINDARSAKSGGTTIYSVKIDSDVVPGVSRKELTTDYRNESSSSVTRYISSQYPSASAVNDSMFGMFNQATVTRGSENNSAAYVYGAAGGNWSDIFAEIKATEGITEESAEPMKNVTITDILSDYVELLSPDAENSGVTLEPEDADVSIGNVTVTGKEVKVTLSGELKDGTTYTVKIPVKPTEQAQTEANQKFTATTNFKSNASATMSYEYDDENKGSVTYAEQPEIVVAKKVKLTYDANAGEDAVTGMPNPAEEENAVGEDAKAVFTITSAAPEREGYTFDGWNTDLGAEEGDESFAGGAEAALGADTTLYAVWKADHKVAYAVEGDAPATSSSLPAEQTYAVGVDIPVAEGLTTTETDKDGIPGTWSFAGWTVPEGVTAGDGSFTMPDYDVTITGTWTFTADQFDVFYFVSGDTPSDYEEPNGPKGVEAGTELEMPVDLTTEAGEKDGVPGTWTFSGWTITSPENLSESEGKYIMPGSDVTIEGSWSFEPATYTVTWVNEDGTVLETDEGVTYGADPSYDGETPTKAEDENNTYTFSGWTPETAPVTGDATYTAVYTANAKEVEEGERYNLVDPVLPEPTEAVAPETVTITWLNYDGTLIEKTTVEYNSTPSHADPSLVPSAEGKTYTFKGWSPEITAATADAAYTAEFTEKDESTGEETDVPVPNPVAPEDTDSEPTNHEELPSITTKSHTYEIYQIFAGDYTDFDGEDILTNIVWGVNGKDPNNEEAATGHPVDPEIIKALHAVVGEELDRTKLDEIEKYVTIDGNPYETITLKPGDEENSIPLPSGYYLIRDVEDSQTGEHDAYTTYITVVIKDYTIQPKSVIPTVDKQVWDNDDGTNGEGWAETADHNINESFRFALIGTIPQNDHLKDYTNGYIVKFTDTMSRGVTFESINKVMVNDTEVDASNYELSEISADEEGKSSWTIQMNVKNIMENVIGEESFGAEGISVVVTYNAHLNENAIVHNTSDDGTTADNTNKNSVYMEYSNNPNTDYEDDMGKTQEDHVWVFTYEVDNIKKADSEDGSPLAGAGFTLLSGDTAVRLIKNGTEYIVADWNAAESESVVTEMVTDSTGVFNIKGLDAGTYTLRETTTPPGYNTAEDIEVVITASHEEAATGNAAELNLTGTNMNNTIINQSGAELPSTGGIGTKLFYMFGVILVLGAGVLLVSRRRAEAA